MRSTIAFATACLALVWPLDCEFDTAQDERARRATGPRVEALSRLLGRLYPDDIAKCAFGYVVESGVVRIAYMDPKRRGAIRCLDGWRVPLGRSSGLQVLRWDAFQKDCEECVSGKRGAKLMRRSWGSPLSLDSWRILTSWMSASGSAGGLRAEDMHVWVGCDMWNLVVMDALQEDGGGPVGDRFAENCQDWLAAFPGHLWEKSARADMERMRTARRGEGGIRVGGDVMDGIPADVMLQDGTGGMMPARPKSWRHWLGQVADQPSRLQEALSDTAPSRCAVWIEAEGRLEILAVCDVARWALDFMVGREASSGAGLDGALTASSVREQSIAAVRRDGSRSVGRHLLVWGGDAAVVWEVLATKSDKARLESIQEMLSHGTVELPRAASDWLWPRYKDLDQKTKVLLECRTPWGSKEVDDVRGGEDRYNDPELRGFLAGTSVEFARRAVAAYEHDSDLNVLMVDMARVRGWLSMALGDAEFVRWDRGALETLKLVSARRTKGEQDPEPACWSFDTIERMNGMFAQTLR